MDERQQPQDGWSYGDQTPSGSGYSPGQDGYGMMPYMQQPPSGYGGYGGYDGYGGYGGAPGMMSGGMPPMGMPAQGGMMQPGMGGQMPPYGAPGQQPPPTAQRSYIENILRLNLGKVANVYCTFENNREWNAKIFHGKVEAAGIDHIIIVDEKTGIRYLILMVYVDYITFEGPINYSYPFS